MKKRKRKLKLDDILYEIEKAPSIKDGLLITIDGKTGYFPKEFIEEAIKAYTNQNDLDPCDVCRFAPPSSLGGKPCTICPAQKKGGE